MNPFAAIASFVAASAFISVANAEPQRQDAEKTRAVSAQADTRAAVKTELRK